MFSNEFNASSNTDNGPCADNLSVRPTHWCVYISLWQFANYHVQYFIDFRTQSNGQFELVIKVVCVCVVREHANVDEKK